MNEYYEQSMNIGHSRTHVIWTLFKRNSFTDRKLIQPLLDTTSVACSTFSATSTKTFEATSNFEHSSASRTQTHRHIRRRSDEVWPPTVVAERRNGLASILYVSLS